MKQKIIVLSVNPYSLIDKQGKESKGTSVRYLPLDNLDPVQMDKDRGTRPAKDNLPYEWSVRFPVAPALYDAELGMKVGSDGKPALYIQDIAYISNIRLELVKESGSTKDNAMAAK